MGLLDRFRKKPANRKPIQRDFDAAAREFLAKLEADHPGLLPGDQSTHAYKDDPFGGATSYGGMGISRDASGRVTGIGGMSVSRDYSGGISNIGGMGVSTNSAGQITTIGGMSVTHTAGWITNVGGMGIY